MRIYPFFLRHAGCPHRCVFCRQERSDGALYPPEPGEVASALKSMLLAGGSAGEVAFYGGSFTLLPPRLQERYLRAVAPFRQAGEISGIRVSTRPDGLGAEAVEGLKRWGVTTVEVGCQSFDPEVLALSGRGHGPREAAGAVGRLRGAGMGVGLQLMPGLPGGDGTEALASLDLALSLHPDFLRIYPTVVLRDSALERIWLEGGYRPWSLEEAVATTAEMLRRCRRASVPVIRLGLQGTPGLDEGRSVSAGPYHPAFGQLVAGRLWLSAVLERAAPGDRGALVHPHDLSDALGHRRCNLAALKERLGDFSLKADSGLPRGSFRLCGGASERQYSIDETKGSIF